MQGLSSGDKWHPVQTISYAGSHSRIFHPPPSLRPTCRVRKLTQYTVRLIGPVHQSLAGGAAEPSVAQHGWGIG